MKKDKEIFFICPTNSFASGGVKQIYRMVDVLNDNGFNAFVVHKKQHRESWFKNSTKILYNPYIFKKIKFLQKKSFINRLILEFYKKISFKISENAIFVFPEIYGDRVFNLFNNQYVIFNQNCYYTFNSIFNIEKNHIYNHSQNKGVICVSENSRDYLKFCFPEIPVYKIRLGIDFSKFNSKSKTKKIAYMPRKLSEDVNQVIKILSIRNQLPNWEFVEIHNKNEAEVGEILGECAIFLSFNHQEGFGLPPVEALACGCYVIGYKGQAGEEYFLPEFSSPIPEGNIVEFATEIEKIALDFDSNPSRYKAKSKLAIDFVNSNYSFENEEKDIVEIWNHLLE